MNELILIDTVCDKDKINARTFDLVRYGPIYYIGFDLYKNFENYLAGNYNLSVFKTPDSIEAQKYFNNIDFNT